MSDEPVNWMEVIGFGPVVRRGPLVVVAGTGLVGDDGSVFAKGDSGAQTRRVLERITERLQSVGAGISDVVQTRVMISRQADWEAVGRAHGEVFKDVKPVTTMAYADLLDPDFLVEIDATAWVGE
jgi:enamine deaminase RidA (YjgF/YER057c/UK114 family)